MFQIITFWAGVGFGVDKATALTATGGARGGVGLGVGGALALTGAGGSATAGMVAMRFWMISMVFLWASSFTRSFSAWSLSSFSLSSSINSFPTYRTQEIL